MACNTQSQNMETLSKQSVELGTEMTIFLHSIKISSGLAHAASNWVGIGRYFAGGKVMGHKVNHIHHLLPRLRMCGRVTLLGHVPSLHAQSQICLYGGITRLSALSISLLSGLGQVYMGLEGVFDPLPFGTSEMPSFCFLEHLHLKRSA